jgi:ABC-type Fe3+/spermidine/putrescine transport system ATPase subunit
VEQVGTPQEIYRHPDGVFVAQFLGMNNFIPGEVRTSDNGKVVVTAIGVFPAPDAASGPATVLLRPDGVQPDGDLTYQISGVLSELSFRGGMVRASLAMNELRLDFDFPSYLLLPSVGERLTVSFDPAQAIQIFSV